MQSILAVNRTCHERSVTCAIQLGNAADEVFVFAAMFAVFVYLHFLYKILKHNFPQCGSRSARSLIQELKKSLVSNRLTL